MQFLILNVGNMKFLRIIRLISWLNNKFKIMNIIIIISGIFIVYIGLIIFLVFFPLFGVFIGGSYIVLAPGFKGR